MKKSTDSKNVRKRVETYPSKLNKTTFQTKYNTDKYLPEKFVGGSDTVPDLAYTVRELLNKFTRQSVQEITRNGEYDVEPDLDNIDPTRKGDLDPADILDFEAEINETFEKVREEVKMAQSDQQLQSESMTNVPTEQSEAKATEVNEETE